MDTDISPTSSHHDQSREPINPSNRSLPGDVDESNKRRKSIAQEEKLPVPSIDPANREYKSPADREYRKNLRKLVSKMFHNIDLSSEDDDQIYPGTIVTDFDSDGDDMLEMEDGVRCMNKSELAEYDRQIKESKGFDIGGFHNVFLYDGLAPVCSELVEKDPFFFELAEQALEIHTTEKGEKFELLEVIKVNQQLCGDHFYYYTLKLKDQTGCEKTYRAKVQQNWETNKISLVLFEEVPSRDGDAKGGSC